MRHFLLVSKDDTGAKARYGGTFPIIHVSAYMVVGRSKTHCVTNVGIPVPFLRHIIMNQYLSTHRYIWIVTAGLAQ